MKGAGKRVLDAIDYAPSLLPALVLVGIMLTWPARVLFS